MAEIHINTFDGDAMKRIAQAVSRLENTAIRHNNALAAMSRRVRAALQSGGVPPVIGRTGTIPGVGSYPSSGCILPVRLVDAPFDESGLGSCPTTPDVREYADSGFVARVVDGQHLPNNTLVLCHQVQNPEGHRWWITPIPTGSIPEAPGLSLVLMSEDLLPGSTNKDGVLMQMNSTTGRWEAGQEAVKVFDDGQEAAMCLAGETVWCQPRPASDNTGATPEYDAIPSLGTFRRVKLSAPLGCGNTSPGVIYRHDPGDVGSATCAPVASSPLSSICNSWGDRRDYATGENVHVAWSRSKKGDGSAPFTGTWEVVPTPRVERGWATADQDQCGDATISITGGVKHHVWKPDRNFPCEATDTNVATVDNPYKHPSTSQDRLELGWDAAANSGAGRWYVIDVVKVAQFMAVGNTTAQTDQECYSTMHLKTFMVESSPTCPTKDQPIFTGVYVQAIDLITNADNQGCPQLSARTVSFCALSAASGGSSSTFLTAQKVSFLDNLTAFCNPQTGVGGVQGNLAEACMLSGASSVGVRQAVGGTTTVLTQMTDNSPQNITFTKKTISTFCQKSENPDIIELIECPPQVLAPEGSEGLP